VTKEVSSQPSNQSKPALGPSKVNNKIFLGSQKGASHLTFFCFCWFLFPFLPLPGIGDSELDALGVGNIDVIVEVDQITTFRTLTEVLYVPGLGSNLFSVSAATANGLIVTFDDNKVSSSLKKNITKKKHSHFFFPSLSRFSLRETEKQSSTGRNKTRLCSNST
jgi:hypothetical protein